MDTLSWLLIGIGSAVLLGLLVDMLRLLGAINHQLSLQMSLQIEAFKDFREGQANVQEIQHDIQKAVLAVKELMEAVQWFREHMEEVGSNLGDKLDRIYDQLDPSSPDSPWYNPAKDPGSDLYMGDEP